MADRKYPDDALRVVVSSEERCTDRYHSGERYGDWSESYDFSITGAKVVDENYETRYEEDGFRIPAGCTQVYILYMTYSTGDTFGSASGKGEVLYAFGSREVAQAALDAVNENKNDFSIEFKDDFGREVKVYNPGAGYFEHIYNIDLEVKLI